jgi:copper chaperone CopZ
MIAVCLLLALPAGDAKPAVKPERTTYRVTGLFAPDRVRDLRVAFAAVPDIDLVAVDFDEAEVTLEFSPAKLFPTQTPERVTKLIDEKLGNVSRRTFGLHPRRTVPRDRLKQVTIPVAGCDCRGCCLGAYEAVAKIDGVYQATASFREGKVAALFDPAKTDPAKLEDALRRLGVAVGKK